MVNLKKFIQPYGEAGAFHSLFAPHRFIDDHVFLTKANQLGVVLRVEGIDYECLTEATLESYTKRAAVAWRPFDDRFRIYQYVVKQDRAGIGRADEFLDPAVRQTVQNRWEYLSSKAQGLFTIQIFYVLLFEPGAPGGLRAISNKNVLRILAHQLERNRNTLLGMSNRSSERSVICSGCCCWTRSESFAFLRLLTNLDPEIAATGQLKYDRHIDYFFPSLPLACRTRESGSVRRI